MLATKLLIERIDSGEHQTIGQLYALSNNNFSVFDCDTLELPWKDNKNQVSCIPIGKYIVRKRYSKKFKYHLHVTDVENRSLILIHKGNFNTDILGCILVGRLNYVNNDDLIDVSNSKATLKELMDILDFDDNGEIELEILNRNN